MSGGKARKEKCRGDLWAGYDEERARVRKHQPKAREEEEIGGGWQAGICEPRPFPDIGKHFTDIGERFLSIGKSLPETGKPVPRIGKPRAKPKSGDRNRGLRGLRRSCEWKRTHPMGESQEDARQQSKSFFLCVIRVIGVIRGKFHRHF